MEDKSIYISGPISNKGKVTPETQLQNVQNGEDVYGALIEKGYAPYCPHMSYYPDKRWKEQGTHNLGHDAWLTLDKQWVWRCKYFFYMLPEIYGESHGARMELQWATDWGKRIFTSVDEVPDKIELQI